MVEPAGAVLIAERGERAVFIRPVEIVTFRELIDLILARPTVAGPPLIPGPLRALAEKLSMPSAVGDVRMPIDIHLTAVDEECLTLLRHQIALREKLPLRIQRTCATCGNTKIQNPNMKVKSKAFENTGMVAGAVLETVGLLAEGHHIRAVIKVIGAGSEIADKNIEEIPACEECQGQDFETPAVTYCPNCRKLRAETILLECPDCAASFVDPASLEDVWVGTDQAYANFRVSANVALFTALAPKFENKLYGDQRAFIVSKLTAADDLIGMCRCSRPGESLRSVALLLTTFQLIWARQLGAGSVSGGVVPWSDVTAVRTFAAGSVQIESAGRLLTFDGLKGGGIGFNGRQPTFTVPGVAALASELSGVDVTLPAGFAPVSASPVSPAFAPPISASPISASPVSPAFAPPISASPYTSPPVVPIAPRLGGPAPTPVPSSAPPATDQPMLRPPTALPQLPAAQDQPAPFPEPVTWIVADPAALEPAELEPAPSPRPPTVRGTAAQQLSTPPQDEPPPPAHATPPQSEQQELRPAPQSAPPAGFATPQSAPPAQHSAAPAQQVAPQPPAQYAASPNEWPNYNALPPNVAPPAPYSPPIQQVAPQSGPAHYPAAAPAPPAYAPPGVPQIDLSSAPPPAPPAAPAWYPDPFGQYRYRWWDGTQWTRTFHR